MTVPSRMMLVDIQSSETLRQMNEAHRFIIDVPLLKSKKYFYELGQGGLIAFDK